jgi:hypothetical protein
MKTKEELLKMSQNELAVYLKSLSLQELQGYLNKIVEYKISDKLVDKDK